MVEVARLSRFRQRGDGGLQISGLEPDDTGMFQCFARNAAGEVQTSTYLAVTSKSGLSCPAPEPVPSRMRALLHARGLLRTEIGSQRTLPRAVSGVARASYAHYPRSPESSALEEAYVFCDPYVSSPGSWSQGQVHWLFERRSSETSSAIPGFPPMQD